MLGMNFKVILDPIPEILARRHLEEGGEVQRYIDSECLRLSEPYTPFLTGTLSSREYLDFSDEQNFKNQELFERLSQWFEECSETGDLPELDGASAQRVEAVDSGYLLSDDNRTGAYQIQCKLIYYKE